MSEIVITAENLSKSYLVGHQSAQRESYTALRDVLAREARNFARKGLDFIRGREIVQGDEVEEFWALRDVSFEVRRGEVLGIIGRNGAGKSTLLKILSRITEPTRGRVTIRGRVASLLEVGTGFHPELTGRENIYLNGAILGMTQRAIRKKFDEIVSFAEVEHFLDTPVKRFSSGMYVRLAFSVAAHLEPEILVVDEVLAVGDASFQKKCLGKMGDISSGGRTVLLVSHNMAAIANLCNKCLLLRAGELRSSGNAQAVIENYLHDGEKLVSDNLFNRTDRTGSGALRFESIELQDVDGIPITVTRSGDSIRIVLRYRGQSTQGLRNVQFSLGVCGAMQENLFHLSTAVSGNDFETLLQQGAVICYLPRLPLRGGTYIINLFCMVAGEIADWVQGAYRLTVEDGDFFRTGKLPPTSHSPILVDHSWAIA
jgi:lipopolysaccharide transport system ATP-binding protein